MSWILCTLMDYGELEWVGPGNVKGNGFKGWHNECILAWWILFDCMIVCCLCQCIIPWGF